MFISSIVDDYNKLVAKQETDKIVVCSPTQFNLYKNYGVQTVPEDEFEHSGIKGDFLRTIQYISKHRLHTNIICLEHTLINAKRQKALEKYKQSKELKQRKVSSPKKSEKTLEELLNKLSPELRLKLKQKMEKL